MKSVKIKIENEKELEIKVDDEDLDTLIKVIEAFKNDTKEEK